MVCGLLLQGAAFTWIAAIASPALGYGSLLPPLLIAGTGISLVFGTGTNAVAGAVPPADVGMAAAVNASFRQIGAPFGIAIASAIFQHAGGFASPQAFTHGFAPAMCAAGAISILGAITALSTGGRQRPPAATPQPARQGRQPAVQSAATASPAAFPAR
jgi:hypothetical protein